MIKIITYPKKQFDQMVNSKEYDQNDLFISIGYTRSHEHFEEGFDIPALPNNSGSLRVKSVKPGFDTPAMTDNPNFLRVKFDDILVDFGPNNLAFTQENAQEIFKFLGQEQPSNTIHIHCQAGQSRSAAVGEALKYIFNEMDINVDLYHTNSYTNPNTTVLRVMFENKGILVEAAKNWK
jgi:predicted protein tyrosine phosphatase